MFKYIKTKNKTTYTKNNINRQPTAWEYICIILITD